MTVPLHDRRSLEPRGLISLGLLRQKLAEEEGLITEPASIFIMGEQASHLVAEDRHAAGLQADHRHATSDRWAQGRQCFLKITPGPIEHPKVVERTAATEQLRRKLHTIPSRL